jgi:dolichol-phosphate mannosyltransferase
LPANKLVGTQALGEGLGFLIREIPIVFVERRIGTSKMSRKIIFEAAWMVWKLRILGLLGRL